MTDEDQELLNEIHSAFKGVTLDDGISLNMTEYLDSYKCEPEFAERAKDDERQDWTTIPDQVLEQFTETFCFTDQKGYRFYLPAYMSWTIRNCRTSDSIIADFTIYAIKPDRSAFTKDSFWEWFTNEQIAVMKKFLEFAEKSADRLDAHVAKENLEYFENV